jgi:hypothetical protein
MRVAGDLGAAGAQASGGYAGGGDVMFLSALQKAAPACPLRHSHRAIDGVFCGDM